MIIQHQKDSTFNVNNGIYVSLSAINTMERIKKHLKYLTFREIEQKMQIYNNR